MFTDDEDFQRMQRFLVAEGRGRKIALRQLPLTNKLLLQANLLRQTCRKSWEEISSLFDTVTEQELLHTSLKSEVNRANRGAAAVHGGSGDIESFLSFNVGDELELRNVGPFLLKTGVKRHQLLSPASLQDIPTPAVPDVDSLILDLLFFQQGAGCVLHREWFDFVGVDIAGLSDKQLRDKLQRTRKPYDSLAKHRSRKNTGEKLQDYLRQTVKHFQLKDGSASKSSTASCTHSSSADASSTQDRSLAFATSGRQLAALRREAEALKSEVCASQEETATLKTTARQRAAEIHELQRKWTTSREEKDLVAQALKISREKLKTANATIAAIQHTNFYKRIKQREIALKQKEATIEQGERQCGQRRQRVEELKKKLKTSQTVVSNMRRRLSVYKTRVQANNERHDQQLVDYMTNDEEQPEVQTTVEGGKKQFTPAVVKAVIALISCGVSAKNCGVVLQAVAKHLFGIHIADKDVPSERTSLRFADQGHFLAKFQIAEAMVEEEHFDLHIDGTTRDHRKYVGQQITSSSGSLCCGFDEVAAEDSKTLVDITIGLLQEVTEVFDEDEKDQHFRTALQHLSGLMSDRASVNKAMKRDVNDLRKATLGTDEDLEFLFCNAHFLLGLSK